MEIEKSILEKSKTLSDLARAIFNNANYTNREKCKKLLAEDGIDWKEWLEEKNTKPKKLCLKCGKEIIGGDNRKKFCFKTKCIYRIIHPVTCGNQLLRAVSLTKNRKKNFCHQKNNN